MSAYSPVIPVVRYRDALEAIAFLQRAFGFSLHAMHEEDGAVSHAQLTWGAGMIMVGTAHGDTSPCAIYVVVEDVDEHHRQAEGAGATILGPPTAQDYGGSNYTALDPEGNVWNFGDYEPE